MRKSSKSKENQRSADNEKTTNSLNLRRRQPLTDKTNRNVTNGSDSKKSTEQTKAIQETTVTRNMRTRRSKETTSVMQTRTRSQTSSITSPKTKPVTKKTVVSNKLRTKKSLDSSRKQKKKISDNELKHLKCARIVLIKNPDNNENKKSKNQSAETNKTDKSLEISGDTLEIKQSKHIPVKKTNRNSDTLVVVNHEDVAPTKTFKKPLAKASIKGRKSNPLAVYEFEYDPKEDPKPKRKRVQLKQTSSDSSGEEENSMKVVVKRLRRLDRKAKQKPTDNKTSDIQENQPGPSKKSKKVVAIKKPKQKTIEVKIQEMFDEIRGKKIVKQSKVIVPPPVVVENVDESCSIVPDANVQPSDKNKSTKEVIEEVANSFLEDDSPDFDDFQPVSPGPINMISNVLVHKPNTSISRPGHSGKAQIFNSTMRQSVRESCPWRLDISAIRKKPHTFTVKEKSFTPSYDQDVITISSKTTILDKSNKDSIDEAKQKESKVNDKKSAKVVNQTSILDFITSSKPRPVANKPVGLFDDVPAKKIASPRRILGEINYVQSTPMKPNNSVGICNSPNVSRISPKRSDTEETMFGYSFLSDCENQENENKKSSPARRSPRKQRNDWKQNFPTRICINEIKRVLAKEASKPNTEKDCEVVETATFAENPKNVHFKEPHIPEPIDSDVSVALFEDPEDNLRVSKRITKQYTRKYPKRKRLPSIEAVDSDNESDTEVPAKKKPKETKRTREEEEEVERLASFYNSMFEEIEQHPLCIE